VLVKNAFYIYEKKSAGSRTNLEMTIDEKMTPVELEAFMADKRKHAFEGYTDSDLNCDIVTWPTVLRHQQMLVKKLFSEYCNERIYVSYDLDDQEENISSAEYTERSNAVLQAGQQVVTWEDEQDEQNEQNGGGGILSRGTGAMRNLANKFWGEKDAEEDDDDAEEDDQ
jgi:hypothetical protein